MEWLKPINWIVENAPFAIENLFWNTLWLASGACLVALLFAVFEQVSGRARYSNSILRWATIAAGLAVLAAGFIGWQATTGDLGRGIDLFVHHIAGTANATETTLLWLLAAGLAIFDVGVYLHLKSEQRPAPAETAAGH